MCTITDQEVYTIHGVQQTQIIQGMKWDCLGVSLQHPPNLYVQKKNISLENA